MCNNVWLGFAVVFIGIKGTETDTECLINEGLSVCLPFPVKSWEDDDWKLFPFGGMNGHNLDCATACFNGCLSLPSLFLNENIQKFDKVWKNLLGFIAIEVSGVF